MADHQRTKRGENVPQLIMNTRQFIKYPDIDLVRAQRGDTLSEAWRGWTPNFGTHQTKLSY